MIIGTIILAVILVLVVIRVAIHLAWSLIKFLFGLGLFAVCPTLFIILGIMGVLGSGWWIIAAAALIFGIGFGKT